MVYILGTKIEENLHIIQGLKKIYGLGYCRAQQICKKFGFLQTLCVLDLKKSDWKKILLLIRKTRTFVILKDLKKIERKNLNNLIDIKSYRGMRHRSGLPVRGQRTHTNSKTQAKLSSKRVVVRRHFSTNTALIGNFLDRVQKVKQFNAVFLRTAFLKALIRKRKHFRKVRYRKYVSKFGALYTSKILKKKRRQRRWKWRALNIRRIVRITRSKLPVQKFNQKGKKGALKLKNLKVNFNKIVVMLKKTNVFLFVYTNSKLRTWVSGGSLGFKGRRKSTVYAGRAVSEKIIRFLRAKKIREFKITVKGFGPARREILKKFCKKGFKISSISDFTTFPHNGCRKPKVRR